MLEYKWEFKELNSTIVFDELNLPNPLPALLKERGINSTEEAKAFFNPRTNQIHSPFLMKDMDKASQRLVDAITKQQKILVYGDYDVDGTTAVACMFLFLQSLNCNVDYYVPCRYNEGYGVSVQGIEFAKQQNIDLIITLDCGIKAFKTTDLANSYGIDVIICDHHEPDANLPNALATLNPKRKNCDYPCKHLSGCGVGFKLIHAVCELMDLELKEYLYSKLDILAISIASDIVPIVGENRVFMHYGLKKLQNKPNVGVKAMLQSANIYGQELTVSDVVFKLGPKINAAGRIYNAKKSIELLIEEDIQKASDLCLEINKYNTERRTLDQNITQEAIDIIQNSNELLNKKSNVLYKADWHKGVIGIVASRVIEHYYKPTIIFCGQDDVITASARSVHGFDIHSALEECYEFIEHFGGHMYAAGLSIKRDNLEKFTEKFEQVVAERITPEQTVPKITIDCEINIDDITEDFYSILKRFGPFGPENMTPVFILKNVFDAGCSVIGKDKSHIRFMFAKSDSTKTVNGIGFGMAKKWEQIKSNQQFDVCFTLQENIFRNTKSIQLEVKDIRIAR